MKLITAKKAHSLIEKRKNITNGVDRLRYTLSQSLYYDYFKDSHVAKLLIYYEELLGEDMGKVNKQIEELK